MSRIGKSPIQLPSTVTFVQDGNNIVVKSTKGELSFTVPVGIEIVKTDSVITVENKRTGKKANALHGLVRAHVSNMITGVSSGWTKTLELVGVGYRASLAGVSLVLSVGYSHQVTIEPPKGITFSITEGKITVSGIDKQLVGQIASNIRSVKEPEPYKGKGIKYTGEFVRRKAGKSAKAVGGTGGK